MVMRSGEHWRCTNKACRCAVIVKVTGEIDGRNPVCACGNAMKKEYSSPAFQYLDFLRFPEPALASVASKKDGR